MSTLTTTQTKVLTNAALKGLLSDALVSRGFVADIDTAKTPGIYYIGDGTANKPTGGYGILIAATAHDMLMQLCVFWYGDCYVRCNQINGTMTKWKRLNYTQIS